MFEDSALSIWASMNGWLTPTVLFLLLNLMIGTIVIASSFSSSPNPHDQTQPLHQGLVRSTSVLQRFKSINFYSYRSQEPDTHFEHDPTKHVVRSSSILQRLQSIKFQFHFPRPEPTHDVIQQEAQTEVTRYASEDNSSDNEEEEEQHEEIELDDDDDVEMFEKEQTLDEIYKQLQMERGHVSRTTSDTKPASGVLPAKLPKKMRKSASAKSAFGHFAAEEVTVVERRRPATVRETTTTKKDETDDEVEEEDDDDVDGGDGGEVDAKADDFINRFKQQLKLQRIDSIIRYKNMIKKGSEAK